MANYATLKAAIQDVIKTNGNNEITGAILQQSLIAMINSLGASYQFVGIATSNTNPGTPDQNVFYIAGPGTYSNFNGGVVVDDGHLAVMKYNGSWEIEQVSVGKNYDADINNILNIISENVGLSYNPIVTIEQGQISTQNGNDSPSASRLRNKGYINATAIRVSASNGDVYVYGYSDTQYISAIGWFSEERTIQIPGATRYRLSFKKTSGAAIVVGEYDSLGVSINIDYDGIVVKFVPQSLSDSQKEQARQNINAASNDDVEEILDGFGTGTRTVTEQKSFTPIAGYVNTSGGTGGVDSYINTGAISVQAGDVIDLRNSNGVVTMRFVCARLNGVAQSTLGASNVTSYTVPLGIDSVILSTLASNNDGAMKYQHQYTEHYKYLKPSLLILDNVPTQGSENPVKSGGVYDAISTLTGNILYSKKWVACGDSFTHGDFSNSPTQDYTIETGQYAGQYKVYPFLIGNRNAMNIVNEAINGSTLTHIDGRTNAFSDTRYQNIPSDADYITLKFGINDDANHQNVPIGTITDTTNATFYGAWNVVLDYLIRNHPQAKIGIIVTNGATLEIAEATIAIAKKWGIAYLNEATDENCSFVFRTNRTNVVAAIRTFRDNYWHVSNTSGSLNYHPNAKAHEFESTVVESWLRSL